MPIRKIFDARFYPTDEEIKMMAQDSSQDLRCPDDRTPEILYSEEMREAWRILTYDERMLIFQWIVAEHSPLEQHMLEHEMVYFRTMAKTRDLRNFASIHVYAADFRDGELRYAFDPARNKFSLAHYLKSMTNMAEERRLINEVLSSK